MDDLAEKVRTPAREHGETVHDLAETAKTLAGEHGEAIDDVVLQKDEGSRPAFLVTS